MTRIAHVLCPIDFSDTSQLALRHAGAIARRSGARLTVAFVFVAQPAIEIPPLVLDDEARARLMSQLRGAASHVASEVPLDFVLVEATSAHGGIQRQLEHSRPDLLVLGSHGRSGFQRLFLGSVTEKVIRQATCPTLVVPPRAAEVVPDAPEWFRHILVPVDFSASALDAVAYAAALVQGTDARLTLLTVVHRPPVFGGAAIAIQEQLASLLNAQVVDAKRQLEALAPEAVRAVCATEVLVAEGSTHEAIVRQAADRGADLIVTGAHGRSAADVFIFGSTTHGVIRASSCPVLVVRMH